jgi:hypothetical protein
MSDSFPVAGNGAPSGLGTPASVAKTSSLSDAIRSLRARYAD